MRTPGVRSEVPPPLELLCLTALWSIQEGNVKDVQRTLAATRPLAYTTVMTLLERLARKGAISRRKVGRAFVYAPAVSRATMQKTALREFLNGFFDGSEERLLEFLKGQAPEPVRAAEATAGAGVLDAALL